MDSLYRLNTPTPTFADALDEVERRGYRWKKIHNYADEARIWFSPAVEIDGERRNYISGRDNVEIMAAARGLPERGR